MSTFCLKKKIVSRGETLLLHGLSIEGIKRAHVLHAKLSDLGFPWESDAEVEKSIFHNFTSDVEILNGDLKVSY